MSALLQVESVDLFYGDAQALDGVSLEIAAGEIVAIVGANGAGKSSLIRTIHGIEKPARGHIRFDGVDISGWPSHRVCEVGHRPCRRRPAGLSQSLGAGEPRDGRHAAPRARAREADPRARVRPVPAAGRTAAAGRRHAVGGEQQMLAIGRCLMGQPRLIMFDEPSLGLAPTIVHEVFRIVRRLNEEGLTVLLVEQNVMASLKIAHRGYVLENGRIELSGTGSELLNDDRVRQAYLDGASSRTAAGPIMSATEPLAAIDGACACNPPAIRYRPLPRAVRIWSGTAWIVPSTGRLPSPAAHNHWGRIR